MQLYIQNEVLRRPLDYYLASLLSHYSRILDKFNKLRRTAAPRNRYSTARRCDGEHIILLTETQLKADKILKSTAIIAPYNKYSF